MNYKTIHAAFEALTFPRKVTLSFMIILLLSFTAGLVFWLLKPDYAILFKQLDQKDAQRIIQQLEVQKIPYQFDDDGQNIRVPKADVGRIRMLLMSNQLNLGGKVGFELFDRNDFGMTDFTQKINYQRALQGELERTISTFNEVAGARVHLVIPEKRLFENNELPSAGVTILLKQGEKLKSTQVSAIQKLIAASVERLTTDRITVVDEQGNALSKSTDNDTEVHFQAKKAIEVYLQKKAQHMLSAIYHDQPAYVFLDVTLNYDFLEKQMETYVPSSDGVTTHIKEIKHEKNDNKHPESMDVTTEKSIQYGRVIEKQQLEKGAVKHLSVSVVIPGESNEALRQRVENIVKNAVGFDSLRGDTMSVEAIGQNNPAVSVLPSIITMPSVHVETHRDHLWIVAAIVLLLGSSIWIYDMRRKNKLLRQVKQLMEQTNANAAN